MDETESCLMNLGGFATFCPRRLLRMAELSIDNAFRETLLYLFVRDALRG